jgi:hypothetical protein
MSEFTQQDFECGLGHHKWVIHRGVDGGFEGFVCENCKKIDNSLGWKVVKFWGNEFIVCKYARKELIQ